MHVCEVWIGITRPIYITKVDLALSRPKGCFERLKCDFVKKVGLFFYK